MTISLKAIEEQAARRGNAYLEAIIDASVVSGDLLDIHHEVFKRIQSTFPPRRGIGDVVEMIAKPIASALGLDCLDEHGQLKPDSGCAKRRDALNQIRI